MSKFKPGTAVFQSGSTKLFSLINLDESTPDRWRPEDLASMVRHQFLAPLAFDLNSMQANQRETRAREQSLREAGGERIRTFEDLLFHREPPVELARLAKDFFKRLTQAHREDSAEWQLAYLFYLLSILAGRSRDPKISTLSANELLKGIKWALSRVWLDQRTREWLVREKGRLAGNESLNR